MATPTTTYLRVKRPRHVAPPSSLRVEGLGDENVKRARPNTVENLAHLLHQSTYIQEQQQQQQQSSAVWKRVETEPPNTQKRSFRYVNAILDNVEEDQEEGPRTKRRRLALTLVHDETPQPAAVKQPPKKNVILDPLSRLVQESLQSVLSGERTVAQHLDFVTQDSRLCDTPRVWLAWEDARNGAGNILHAAALTNEVQGASDIVSWNVPSLVTSVDGNGQTPYQVAVAVGHTQVAQVLELSSGLGDNVQQQDDTDYVYDVFRLDKNMSDGSNDDDNEDEEPTSVELRGGIGYWNENGELILEALEEMQEDDSDNDVDEDSNCEEHERNDYPEEEETQFWDSDEEEEISFRHRPIYMSQGDVRAESGPQLIDEDEEYDAQYDLYEPSGPQRVYAYDPELDSSSESDE